MCDEGADVRPRGGWNAHEITNPSDDDWVAYYWKTHTFPHSAMGLLVEAYYPGSITRDAARYALAKRDGVSKDTVRASRVKNFRR